MLAPHLQGQQMQAGSCLQSSRGDSDQGLQLFRAGARAGFRAGIGARIRQRCRQLGLGLEFGLGDYFLRLHTPFSIVGLAR